MDPPWREAGAHRRERREQRPLKAVKLIAEWLIWSQTVAVVNCGRSG